MSKESIAGVILHELYHGILSIKFGNAFPTISDQHEHMFVFGGCNLIKDALVGLYPTTLTDPKDAAALGIAGTWDALYDNFPSSPAVKQNMNNICLQLYGLSINEALNRATAYENSTTGTPSCY